MQKYTHGSITFSRILFIERTCIDQYDSANFPGKLILVFTKKNYTFPKRIFFILCTKIIFLSQLFDNALNALKLFAIQWRQITKVQVFAQRMM